MISRKNKKSIIEDNNEEFEKELVSNNKIQIKEEENLLAGLELNQEDINEEYKFISKKLISTQKASISSAYYLHLLKNYKMDKKHFIDNNLKLFTFSYLILTVYFFLLNS